MYSARRSVSGFREGSDPVSQCVRKVYQSLFRVYHIIRDESGGRVIENILLSLNGILIIGVIALALNLIPRPSEYLILVSLGRCRA